MRLESLPVPLLEDPKREEDWRLERHDFSRARKCDRRILGFSLRAKVLGSSKNIPSAAKAKRV